MTQKAICEKLLAVRCGDCEGEFHKADFTAEEDTEFAGHYSLSCTKCGGAMIFVVDENTEQRGEKEIKSFAEKKYKSCKCGGSYIFSFTKVTERNTEILTGIPFSEFRKLYKAPLVQHSCIFCSDSFNTTVVNEIDPKDFEKIYSLEYAE